MHFQYPLETLARRREAASQLAFAREATHALPDSDEVLFEPIDRGLAIFAANESALARPVAVLRDIYGERIEVRRPKVRYMPGDPPHEPVMHVRIASRREWAGPVLRELRLRGATVIEECIRPRIAIVRAEAPLAQLLGLPARIDAITGGEAECAIRLVRYAPLPPDGEAA